MNNSITFGWKSVIEARIKHFDSHYHKHEAQRLQQALFIINKLVPPSEFEQAAIDLKEGICPVCDQCTLDEKGERIRCFMEWTNTFSR